MVDRRNRDGVGGRAMDLDNLFAHYGYLALILGSFADGTPVMLFGGFAAHRGWLVLIPSVILAGAVGNFLAGSAWFFAIRAVGEQVLTRRPRWAAEVARVRSRLERWEAPFILGIRFVPGLATGGLIAIALSGIAPARVVEHLDHQLRPGDACGQAHAAAIDAGLEAVHHGVFDQRLQQQRR